MTATGWPTAVEPPKRPARFAVGTLRDVLAQNTKARSRGPLLDRPNSRTFTSAIPGPPQRRRRPTAEWIAGEGPVEGNARTEAPGPRTEAVAEAETTAVAEAVAMAITEVMAVAVAEAITCAVTEARAVTEAIACAIAVTLIVAVCGGRAISRNRRPSVIRHGDAGAFIGGTLIDDIDRRRRDRRRLDGRCRIDERLVPATAAAATTAAGPADHHRRRRDRLRVDHGRARRGAATATKTRAPTRAPARAPTPAAGRGERCHADGEHRGKTDENNTIQRHDTPCLTSLLGRRIWAGRGADCRQNFMAWVRGAHLGGDGAHGGCR